MAAPRVVDMLKTLIEEPSVSCTRAALDQSNLAVIHHLAGWLEDLGFSVEVMPLPNNSAKANMIARLGSGNGGLVLAGHTDTVPCDESLWTCNPFELADRDDRFYGLGTCDMKGFFPLAIDAARNLSAAELSAPLTILATSDEESSMAGARALMDAGRPNAACAVIGEPTNMMPVYAHKGFMMLRIGIEGASGHSSNPELGLNALDTMHCVMSELLAFRGELAATHRNPAFEVAFPTLNLGCLAAGDNPNRICSHAELQIDLRLLPGMDDEDTLVNLRRRLQRVALDHATPITVDAMAPPVPPFETAPDGDLVRTLEKLSGNRAGTVAFGTEGHFLQQLGMETVVFGPGSIDQAHQPDEYLDQNTIGPTIDVLRALIAKYCVTNREQN
jgi:acetylornithine deacetylase